MQDDPYQRPWLAPFLPPKPAPTVPPAAIAEYLKSLERPTTSPTVSAPVVERSVLEKITDATRRVRRTVTDRKLNKSTQLQWTSQLFLWLRPFYGKQSRLIQMLDQWRKEITKTQLSTEDFVARVEQVEHYLRSFNAPAVSGSLVVASQPSLIPATKNIFVIHGHDEVNQLRLSKLIREDFKLEPVVLLDKPGRSAPTIEKFEQHAQSCSYAIALFTADDHITTKTGDQYWQPRPNVIFETGWFVGRLGKQRVLILLQEGVKIHSDFEGVNRIQFLTDVEDKFRAIGRELEAARLIQAGRLS
jgi:predicted nucleotide-binding protein